LKPFLVCRTLEFLVRKRYYS